MGDRDSMNRLLTALQARLYAHIFGILRNHENAEDVLQEALFSIARNLGSLTDPRWVIAWSYRIANRKAMRRSQKTKREESRIEDRDINLMESREADRILDDGALAQLRAEVDSLSPASSIVLRMHYLEEMTYSEISEALEISIGTVKSRLNYGLNALRMSQVTAT